MLTHEQMQLRDEFGRPIVICDREEHAKYWCKAQRREIAAEHVALNAKLDALEARLRDVEQLEDEIARVRRAS